VRRIYATRATRDDDIVASSPTLSWCFPRQVWLWSPVGVSPSEIEMTLSCLAWAKPVRARRRKTAVRRGYEAIPSPYSSGSKFRAGRETYRLGSHPFLGSAQISHAVAQLPAPWLQSLGRPDSLSPAPRLSAARGCS
jgi:hypothetical protein